MTRAIEIRGLDKVYQSGFFLHPKRALRGLDLEVPEGGITGFLGPNGAGKTTTIKVLAGLIFPTAGEVRIYGKPVMRPSSRQWVGFLPENPYYYDYLRVEEFLDLCARLFRIERRERRLRIDRMLELVEMSEHRKLPLRKLSKGMLQRIGIAQALINDPKLLILDEPMSGLDPMGRRSIRDILLRLGEEGKTIFFSSHVLPDVEMICDNVAIIFDGALCGFGRLRDLLLSEQGESDLTVEGLPPETFNRLSEMAKRTVGEGHRMMFTLDGLDQADKAARLVLESGGRIVSLVSHRLSLEDLFLAKAEAHGEKRRPGSPEEVA